MIRNPFSFALLMLLAILILFLGQNVEASERLSVDFKPRKANVILGEVFHFALSIQNLSDEEIYLKGTNVNSGYIEIMVSEDDITYRRYVHSGWGVAKRKGRYLKAKGYANSSGTLFWNSNKNVKGLSTLAIRSIQRRQLMRDYIFEKVGDFFLRARLYYPVKKEMHFVESAPVRISVRKGSVEESEVWETIRNEPRLGYFIQEGQSRSSKFEAQERDADLIRALYKKYHSNRLSYSLKASLLKYERLKKLRRGR